MVTCGAVWSSDGPEMEMVRNDPGLLASVTTSVFFACSVTLRSIEETCSLKSDWDATVFPFNTTVAEDSSRSQPVVSPFWMCMVSALPIHEGKSTSTVYTFFDPLVRTNCCGP